MSEVHARLSASGSKRWMACPPSANLEAKFKEETSQYATEGTLAHAIAELTINYNLKAITKAEFNKKLKKLKEDPQYNEEMMEYVEGYVQLVWEAVNEVEAKCGDVIVMTEQRLDFSDYVPDGFGTGDVVIIADYTMQIIDLKYGKGVGVSAQENPQLRLYGLGALTTYGMLYDINYVKMTIIQPRLDNISYEELPVEELIKWGEEVVRPAAQLAASGKGEFKAGDHCKFCKARKTCRARAEYNQELAKFDFVQPDLLEDEEIGEILRRADRLASWVKDIQEYALQSALNGTKFDGWKVVEGRSTRKYADEIAVANTLKDAGFAEELLYTRDLLEITAMEKVVGKKKFSELLKDLIVKPEGKPTLVPESDKRPELKRDAASDFDDIKDGLDAQLPFN